MIVTHTTVLRQQWEDEVRKLFGIEPGVIGGGTINISEVVTIGNIQTLTRNLDMLKESFGTVIIDECLDYEAIIDTDEGPMKIGAIVNNKRSVKVRSFDLSTNKEVYKPIVNWYKNKAVDCLKISTDIGSIKATGNHSIYVYKNELIEKVQASELNVGDNLVLTRNRHKSASKLNPRYWPLVLGLILGDGSLDKTGSNIRLRVTHGEDQLEYLLYKEKMLNSIVQGDIITGSSGYGSKEVYQLQSLTFNDDLNLQEALYSKVNGRSSKRELPEHIASMLTAESWAIIYQDDGSINKEAITFSFCEMTDNAISNLVSSLVSLGVPKEHIKPYACNKCYNYIRLNKLAAEEFLNIVKNYMHPSMYYKFGDFQSIKTSAKYYSPGILKDILLDFYTRPVKSIEPSTLTGGHRFNIEVEGTHTYFANGILVANCHHCPATTFSELIDKMKSRYKIGLSGTLERKDGLHVIFNDYFGFNVQKPLAENYMPPEVLLVKSKIPLGVSEVWATKVTELCSDIRYLNLIVELTNSAIKLGHTVLVVADRVELLKYCTLKVPEAVCVTGETPLESRKILHQAIKDGKAKALFGTMSIYSEGISINELSCLILAAQINNDPLLTQLIGRVTRIAPNKPKPLIIDINLGSPDAKKQARARTALYLRNGYEIKSI